MRHAQGQVRRLDGHLPTHRRSPIRLENSGRSRVKEVDSLTSRGLCVIAVTGVFNWRSPPGTLGGWEYVPLKGAESWRSVTTRTSDPLLPFGRLLARGTSHFEERAGEAQGLVHCSCLLRQQVSGLFEGLTSSPSRLSSLLQALQYLSHGG